ncbi:unnamed protein product [Prunus armeniaca]
MDMGKIVWHYQGYEIYRLDGKISQRAQKAGKPSMRKDHHHLSDILTEAELYVFLEETEISFTTSTLKKPGRTDLEMKTLRSNQHTDKL